MSFVAQASTAVQQADPGWVAENATLIVGLAGILVSGVLGPSVAAWLTGRRERSKDKRAVIASRRDDLRSLVDETARVLGGAVTAVRPLLAAELEHKEAPQEPRDFLAQLTPLGQRLQLRLRATHEVVTAYEATRNSLVGVAGATESQAAFDAAVEQFETARQKFLDEARKVLQAPVNEDGEL